jgi:hypothetical protein
VTALFGGSAATAVKPADKASDNHAAGLVSCFMFRGSVFCSRIKESRWDALPFLCEAVPVQAQ